MFDEGNWLVAEPFGHNDFDAFSVIDKEFLEPFLQPCRSTADAHRDDIAIDVHRFNATSLEQRAGDKISRAISQDIVGRTVNLVPHTGEGTIGLKADHATH